MASEGSQVQRTRRIAEMALLNAPREPAADRARRAQPGTSGYRTPLGERGQGPAPSSGSSGSLRRRRENSEDEDQDDEYHDGRSTKRRGRIGDDRPMSGSRLGHEVHPEDIRDDTRLPDVRGPPPREMERQRTTYHERTVYTATQHGYDGNPQYQDQYPFSQGFGSQPVPYADPPAYGYHHHQHGESFSSNRGPPPYAGYQASPHGWGPPPYFAPPPYHQPNYPYAGQPNVPYPQQNGYPRRNRPQSRSARDLTTNQTPVGSSNGSRNRSQARAAATDNAMDTSGDTQAPAPSAAPAIATPDYYNAYLKPWERKNGLQKEGQEQEAHELFTGIIIRATHATVAQDRRGDPATDRRFVQSEIAKISVKGRPLFLYSVDNGYAEVLAMYGHDKKGIKDLPDKRKRNEVPVKDFHDDGYEMPTEFFDQAATVLEMYDGQPIGRTTSVNVHEVLYVALNQEIEPIGEFTNEGADYVVKQRMAVLDRGRATADENRRLHNERKRRGGRQA